MNKLVKPSRIITLFVALALLLATYGSAIYRLQVTDASEYISQSSATSVVTTKTVKAERGDILDRNGVVLVSNKTIYDIKLSRELLLEQDDPNGMLLRLINAADKYGIEYEDTFPVTKEAPFSYVSPMTDSQQERLNAYLDYFKLDRNISASDLIVWMKDHYGLDYTTSLNDTRLIIGIRYELEIRAIMSDVPEYVFASDVSTDVISSLLGQEIPFVSVDTDWERVYNTEYAAHVLGIVGKMDEEEYAQYKDEGYSMDAIVGKSGVELAFENYLHGTDGTVTTTTEANGTVTNISEDKAATAGDNVYLTIDIGLQEVAERALASTISDINANRTSSQELAEGGAVVITDVNSGEVLACASYPTYNLSTYYDDYEKLVNDDTLPLYNRATLGTYNPGSTFKMVTAYAGLKSGFLTLNSTHTCTGRYTEYSDYQPACWVYPAGHGTLNVVGAIENSCNVFFYWVGDNIGADAIENAATQFGFGEATGIEIPEDSGVLGTPEYKSEVTGGDEWWAADTLITAIGQGYNMFTPIQMANYVGTIANGGTVYKTTLLDGVKTHDYSSTLYSVLPSVKSEVENANEYFPYLQEGMELVASSGTAESVFGDYPIKIAAKTGTVQSDNSSINSGVFICYAPADDPQIAISVVVENGGSGSGITSVAKSILDYYFADNETDVLSAENTLIK